MTPDGELACAMVTASILRNTYKDPDYGLFRPPLEAFMAGTHDPRMVAAWLAGLCARLVAELAELNEVDCLHYWRTTVTMNQETT